MAIDLKALLDFHMPPASTHYTKKDTILYALGVGCGTNDDDLCFVYEKGLVALPTLAVTLGADSDSLRALPPGIDLRTLVHGEQTIYLYRPVLPAGSITTHICLDSLCDQGSGNHAIIRIRRDITDSHTGEPLARLYDTLIARGAGGFNGPSIQLPSPPPPPPRQADKNIQLQLSPRAAALYRLTGDMNPLHIDPDFAQKAGFERPVLHGLCTLGSVIRAIIRACFHNNPADIETIDVRFSKPVYPGDELTIQIWKEDRSFAFEAISTERNEKLLKNGRIKLRSRTV